MPVTVLYKEAELVSGTLDQLATLTPPATVHTDHTPVDKADSQASNYSHLTRRWGTENKHIDKKN